MAWIGPEKPVGVSGRPSGTQGTERRKLSILDVEDDQTG